MKADFEVRNDVAKRTIFTRMTGVFDAAEMTAWAKKYRLATDSYGGRTHLVIADMRGMKTARPKVAEILGAAIGHARAHGVALCAHLSDDTVQRLQVARVARSNSPHDDVTVDVSSLEEAHRVCDEVRDRLNPSGVQASVRSLLGEGQASEPRESTGSKVGR
ncbi:MAG TPA: hypothetical protein VHV30_15580 [Polyangiaceae bacterium]|jgi:hypothetical protein|nr:hypothetical protein [Polyangiaceae bacterium]